MPIHPFMTRSLVLTLAALPVTAQQDCAAAQDSETLSKACAEACTKSIGQEASAARPLTRQASDVQQSATQRWLAATPRLLQEEAEESGVSADTERGYLGIQVSAGDGAQIVQNVFPGTAAAKAGLEVGDRIVRIAGVAVGEGTQALAGLKDTKPGSKVSLRVERNGWTRDMEVTLGAFDGAWQSSQASEQEEIEEVEDEDDFQFEVFTAEESSEEGEQEEGAHTFRWRPAPGEHGEHEDSDGKHFSHSFELPGGSGKIEIHVQGDGADHLLEKLHSGDLGALGDLGCKIVIQSDGEIHVGEGEAGRFGLRLHAEGDHDLGEALEEIIVIDPEHNVRFGDHDLSEVIEKIRKEVKGGVEKGLSLRGQGGNQRVRIREGGGSGSAGLESMRREIAELREQIAGLRKLRDEMREVRELRTEIRALIEKLGRDR